jgi:hypothetical protein
MTIWLLTVVLLASLAALGFRQGAIRVAASFLGILLGALLSPLLGRLFRPLLALVGVHSPLLLTFVPPLIGFMIILAAFKIGGLVLHKKTEMHYRYKAGVQLMLWERLNHRVGLALGLLNGAAYLVLLSMAIYMLSYWTYQMATSESDPTVVRIVNRLGKDLETTGLSKVAKAVDRAPTAYYDAADIVGLIYHNPLLEARLSRYPAFLGLAERPEFQALASDAQFTEAWQGQKSAAELLKNPSVQAILKNPETVKAAHDIIVPDLPDLRSYLETGISPKYDAEKILGRWHFDLPSTLTVLRKSKPNLNRTVETRRLQALGYGKTVLVATTEGQAFAKNVPHLRPGAAAPEVQNLQGQWKNADGKYELTFNIDGKMETLAAQIQGDRMVVTGPGMEVGMIRED